MTHRLLTVGAVAGADCGARRWYAMTTLTEAEQSEAAVTPPDMAKIFTALINLGVPMKGWWSEADGDEGPSFGVEPAAEARRDWDADWLYFTWDTDGWTMRAGCESGSNGPAVPLDIADPFDVTGVAKYLKAVIDGEISEFGTARAS